jgi:hypothetical protein
MPDFYYICGLLSSGQGPQQYLVFITWIKKVPYSKASPLSAAVGGQARPAAIFDLHQLENTGSPVQSLSFIRRRGRAGRTCSNVWLSSPR